MSERFSVPLYMLPHNIKALIAAHDASTLIHCNGISMMHDPESVNGVILVVSMSEEQKVEAKEAFGFEPKGFRGSVE